MKFLKDLVNWFLEETKEIDNSKIETEQSVDETDENGLCDVDKDLLKKLNGLTKKDLLKILVISKANDEDYYMDLIENIIKALKEDRK